MTMDRKGAALGCLAPFEPRTPFLSRRAFLAGSAAGLGALGLGGCVTADSALMAEAATLYGPMPDEKFAIPAVDIRKVNPKYYRRTVSYASKEAPGTIVVDPGQYYVYRIEGDGTATRYGANVGRDRFLWSGDAYVGRKSEWATWTPPKEMIKRQPEAAKYAGGYTIYASSDPESIGSGITSGCVGLLSQDMIHLYARTPVKTKVVVLPA